VSVDIVVIGASAGGVRAVKAILGELPPDFPAIVCVVVHIPAWRKSVLPSVLAIDGRSGMEAANHQTLSAGRVYIAPADHHLLVDHGEAILWHGPKENSHRPAINALFRSAAVAYGAGVAGVVLSGVLEDGATGLWWIKRHGGVAIVQDPKDAQFPSMPESALSTVDVDYCLPAQGIARVLIRLASNSRSPDESSRGGEANV
jgi:two-component system, chemotaxis family, protein-glutamate methylesterase/glutaminase